MTLNDLNRKLRDIVNQLSSGEIPLVDEKGNEISFDLALDSDMGGNIVCIIKDNNYATKKLFRMSSCFY